MNTDNQGKPVEKELFFLAYPPNRWVYVGKVLGHDLFETREIRKGGHQPLLSFRDPHSPVTKDMMARWILEVMASAGIDINIFNAHSVRSASVLVAGDPFVPVKDMERAGWSNESTFQKFYNKPVANRANYQHAILGGV